MKPKGEETIMFIKGKMREKLIKGEAVTENDMYAMGFRKEKTINGYTTWFDGFWRYTLPVDKE